VLVIDETTETISASSADQNLSGFYETGNLGCGVALTALGFYALGVGVDWTRIWTLPSRMMRTETCLLFGTAADLS
jgi:hypothetical protein